MRCPSRVNPGMETWTTSPWGLAGFGVKGTREEGRNVSLTPPPLLTVAVIRIGVRGPGLAGELWRCRPGGGDEIGEWCAPRSIMWGGACPRGQAGQGGRRHGAGGLHGPPRTCSGLCWVRALNQQGGQRSAVSGWRLDTTMHLNQSSPKIGCSWGQ